MRARLAAFLRRRVDVHVQRQVQRRRVNRLRLQVLFGMALVLVSLGLLHLSYTQHVPVASFTQGTRTPLSYQPTQPESGWGSGNSATTPRSFTSPTFCNPFDPGCFANAMGAWAAGAILSGLQPITSFFQNSDANIITQTPASDSYNNTMVGIINTDLVHAVDVALACLLLIGGYNVILGHHLRIERTSITELLPRAILVTCSVHFNLLFIGLFIDLNNALCNTIIAAASYQVLTNVIGSFLIINPLAGLMLIILIIIVTLLLIFLLAQMITRIALVALLIAVAPLALACFALPQTMRWGRLWFTTFSSAVLVQFLQVTALALGGMLISTIGDTLFSPIDLEMHQLAKVFLAIGMVIITLKIPGMLQTWALHPMMAASSSLMNGATEVAETLSGGGGGGGNAGNNSETVAKVAELLALL